MHFAGFSFDITNLTESICRDFWLWIRPIYCIKAILKCVKKKRKKKIQIFEMFTLKFRSRKAIVSYNNSVIILSACFNTWTILSIFGSFKLKTLPMKKKKKTVCNQYSLFMILQRKWLSLLSIYLCFCLFSCNYCAHFENNNKQHPS